MAQKTVCMLTFAPMGSGKTFTRCASFILDEWLPNHKGVHYSNFPINFENLVAAAWKYHRIPEEEVLRRVKVFDEDTMRAFYGEVPFTPEDWAQREQIDLTGSHLAFDEAHLILPRSGRLEQRRAWLAWIKRVRHYGGTVEFLTQNYDGMDPDLRQITAVRLDLRNMETERDPLFGISMYDWYQLKGKFTREWSPCIVEKEMRRGLDKWQETRRRRVYLGKKYFALYDSFDKAEAAGEKAQGGREKYPFEEKSWIGLLSWFFRRNWGGLVARGAAFVALWWLFLGGGLSVGIQAVTSSFMNIGNNTVEAETTERVNGDVNEQGEIWMDGEWVPEWALRPAIGPGDPGYEEFEAVQGWEGTLPTPEEQARAPKPREVLTAIAPDIAWLRTGGAVAVGEVVLEGEYEGLEVSQIDVDKRAVHFSSGDILRMRSQPSDNRTRTTAFSTSTGMVSGRTANFGNGGSQVSQVDNAGGDANARASLPPVSGGYVGSLNNLDRGTGQRGSVPRGEGRADRPSAVTGGASSGSVGDVERRPVVSRTSGSTGPGSDGVTRRPTTAQ